ncbi:MAG: M28 family peptidase [Bacteroidota bacterium]
MKYPIQTLFFLFVISMTFTFSVAQDSDDETIKSIFDKALSEGNSYQNLDVLSNRIGGRLSGSPEAAAAVEWSKQLMESYNFDKVYLQEVMVPHWVRSDVEIARITGSPSVGNRELHITSLGNSLGTGEKGVHAEIIEVKKFEDFDQLTNTQVEGKIVFFSEPMDPTLINTFDAYSKAVRQRSQGPSKAASKGALAVLVRSMGLFEDDAPHTGALRYDESVKKIPAVAVSTNDATLLSDLLGKGEQVKVYLENHCEMLPDVLSYNVIGELTGSEKPKQYITVGGHLDAWDNGDGAHDDGSGCVQSIEVLRIFKELDIRPKNTIRAVMFMNEENGLRGGRKYAEQSKAKSEKHIAAIESDRGGFVPIGFSIDSDDKTFKKIQKWQSLFEPYNMHKFIKGYAGADIGPLKDQGVALIGYLPDPQRYFKYHHTNIDTFEAINQRELEMGAAAMASLVYLIDQYGL